MAVDKYPDNIAESKFEEIITQNKLVLVDCFADWCGPCKMMVPIFDELSEKYPEIKFVSINTDNCEWINGKYGIDSIPRFLFFENGKKIYEQRGSSAKENFEFIIKVQLLKAEFKTYVKYDGISEADFDELVKSKSMMVLMIKKENSQLTDMFTPVMIVLSEKHTDIHFGSIDFEKTPWIVKRFGIQNADYEKYLDPEKKLPYFLFYKNGELLKETGPVPDISSIIKGPMLGLVKVQEFEEGIKKEEFDKIIFENKLVVVDIFTTWCGPCKQMRPIFEDLSTKYNQIKFISVDLDRTEWLATHDDYGTDSIPTFLFIKSGRLVQKQVGGMDYSKFEQLLKKSLL